MVFEEWNYPGTSERPLHQQIVVDWADYWIDNPHDTPFGPNYFPVTTQVAWVSSVVSHGTFPDRWNEVQYSQYPDDQIAMPIAWCQARQGDYTVAQRATIQFSVGTQGRWSDNPSLGLTHMPTWSDTTHAMELHLGPIGFYDDQLPTVTALLWSFVNTQGKQCSDGPQTESGMFVINQFDASDRARVATITYEDVVSTSDIRADWIIDGTPTDGPYWVVSTLARMQAIIIEIDGVKVLEADQLIQQLELDEELEVVTDEAHEFPFWLSPRVLQPTEDAQGGGQRVAIFTKRIRDLGDPHGFIPDQFSMHVYGGEGLDWSISSLVGNFTSAGVPFVKDSSDRFIYLYNFPMRLDGDDPFSPVFWDWMISHDGTVKNPLGVFPRPIRMDWPTFIAEYGMEWPAAWGGVSGFSSIKNSDLLPGSPPLAEY
jgi:hypothetical protein